MAKAIARLLDTTGGYVVEINDGSSYQPLTLISFGSHKDYAEGFMNAVNSGCLVCWGIAGKHRQIFHPTQSSGGGEVEGHYVDCPNQRN